MSTETNSETAEAGDSASSKPADVRDRVAVLTKKVADLSETLERIEHEVDQAGGEDRGARSP